MRWLSEEEIKNMANLLLSGAKMLPKHCPACGSPLFEYRGKIFCPRCESFKKKKELRIDEKKEKKDRNILRETNIITVRDVVKNSVISKINELCYRLKHAQDLQEIHQIMKSIETGLRVIDLCGEDHGRA